jgi:mannose-1-phosphate guanylyltransferase/mannose-6-phosphate isomerase
VRSAAAGGIAILGIVPDRPETGYGYIRAAGGKVAWSSASSRSPTWPPPSATCAEGGYFWNAGMFVLRPASVWMAALERFRPDIATACRAAFAVRAAPTPSSCARARPSSPPCRRIGRLRGDGACPGSASTSAWSAGRRLERPGRLGRRLAGGRQGRAGQCQRGRRHRQDSRNTLVHATSRLVSAVGLHDVIVVETPDAVLVADRERSQDVKNIVAQLGREQRGEQTLHRKVHRPWGWYDSIDQGPRHQVKRILVKPGASLSLQMHHHRAEHWIVVSGTAEVTNGDKVILLTENQSTYIPLGQTHRLANPGKVPLEIIEVQSGSYLGEDDIVRFEDTYGRALTMSVLVTGGAGFIGSNFVLDWLATRRRAGRQPRRADLRRQPAQPGQRCRAMRATASCTATSPTARCSTACSPSTARAPSCTSRPRATSTAASTAPAPS